MASESASASHDDRDSDDEDYEEAGGGSRLLGFMFGNVDNSGELEVDYLDEDAKEHLDALADKLGASLSDIDLSGKSQVPAATGEEEYDEKAEDAVDYEDIDEQYEGPEIETAATEEDHLLPKRDYFSVDVSATTLSSIYDDENYDEYEGNEEKAEVVASESEVETLAVSGLVLDQGDAGKHEHADNDSTAVETTAPVEQPQNDIEVSSEGICLKPLVVCGAVQTDSSTYLAELEEEESALSHDAVDVKISTPLPILCVENGMAVLRFSEIFGVNEPLKKAIRREQNYSVSRDKYISLDPAVMVEEDEEEFLKGRCQSFPALRLTADTHDSFTENDTDCPRFDCLDRTCSIHDERKDSCLSAEPMRKGLSLDLPAEWQSCKSNVFYSFDHEDWEDRIDWGNSPAVSENSVESCELSGPDSEIAAHEEKDITSCPHNSFSDCTIISSEKGNRSQDALDSVSVEPFDRGDIVADSNASYAESMNHPQLLRLESRLDSSKFSETRKGLRPEDYQRLDFMKRFELLALQNKDLVEGSWIENIIWESERPITKPKLIFDLQDEHMVFEISDNKDYEDLQPYAGALITMRSGDNGADAFEVPGHVALSGGRFDIANDKFYSNRRTSPQMKSLHKKRAANGVKIVHSNPARMLQTMKLKLSNKDLANFHRPKAVWYPHDNMIAVKELEKLHKRGPMKVILKSLGGKGSKVHVDTEETIASFKAKASKKLDFEITEPVKIFYSGKELEDHKTIAELNVRPNSLLHLVRTTIFLLPMAQKVPSEKKSWCPPSGFKKKSDLSVRDGHVFLMEYCEERPLLVGNAGMAARLCTFYQKSSLDDQAGDLLRNADSGLGTVLTLDPSDKSPFLGDIKPGCYQSCLETNMYKAPVFPHKVASTDYLLVRSAKGKLSIRRIDKVYVVGQQEPLKEVLPPGAKVVQNYQINRLLSYVYHEFRAAEKRNALPCVRADVLPAQFPNIQEPILRKRLKHCADLQRKGPSGLLHWVKKPTYRMPSDQDIHNLVLPEDVCAYESMQAGLYRLKRLGITRLAQTGPTQLATISSAMNQLPDEAIALAAASHIERELQITPWNLSANFVACIRQDRGNIERLEISGVGDPSGRGLGFSYVRVAQKPPMSNALVKKKPVVAKGSTVTGTDADLRRLSMDAAREVLLKFSIPEEQIEKLSRWHRIALIRKLSSEQAASGVKVDESTINKYARGQRMSYNQLQQQTREKCQDIWDRQIQSLSAVDGEENESDTEANSDLDSFAGDLENLLDAEEGEEGEEGSVEIKNFKSDGVKGLKMRRHPPQARLQEKVEDEAAEAAELCKILMEDDGAKWKRKPKTIGEGAGGTRRPQWKFETELAQQAIKPNTFVKHNDETAVSYDVSSAKHNNELMEVEKMLPKKTTSAKVKAAKKNEVVPVELQNKKIRITTDGGIKAFKEKKSARDSFVCGACGQLGHMRTNKNCPKYREDPEGQVYTDQEMEAAKPTPQDSSQSQQRVSAKKSMASMPSTAQVEALEGEKSKLMTKTLKVKYASADKAPDKATSVQSLGSDQPSTSEAEVGNKRGPKIIKIISNRKPDNPQVELQKLNVVIRPPSDIGREQQHKRITIKRPKKEFINLDPTSEEGTDMGFRKTKKMVELAGYGSGGQQNIMHFAEEALRKNKAPRRMWEVEEELERMQNAQATSLFQEEMMADEEGSLDELRRYGEDIHNEREEVRKANKRTKKKRRAAELSDDYLEDFQARRNSRSLPGRDRTAKRKTIKFGAENVPSKRRRGGEVGLANILESIVDTLKSRREVSYLFLKPVTKKDAPDYLEFVKCPMDLSTIKERARRLEYRNRDEFRRDVWQIAANAHVYNDARNPNIPPLADQLLDICDHLLNQYADDLEAAEDGITDI